MKTDWTRTMARLKALCALSVRNYFAPLVGAYRGIRREYRDIDRAAERLRRQDH